MQLFKKRFDYTYDISTETTDSGRTYFTPDGPYPSITTILGATADALWLKLWKERVGEEEAKRISKLATDRGELVHLYAERYFNGEDISGDLAKESPDVIQMSKNLIKITKTGVTEIWGQEQVLWSKKLEYAGRCDMVGKWNGVPSIIDFKTSKKPKTVSQIRDYFIQTCGYAVAHNEMYGTGIKNVVILITVENSNPQKFETSAVPFLPELKQRRNQYRWLKG